MLPVVVWFTGSLPVTHIINNLKVITHPYNRGISDVLKVEFFSLTITVLAFDIFIKYSLLFLLMSMLVDSSANTTMQMIIKVNKSKQYRESHVLRRFQMMSIVFSILRDVMSHIALIILYAPVFLVNSMSIL